MLLAALLPLLAQASAPSSAPPAEPPTMDETRLAVCLDQAKKDPQTAIVTASGWIGEASDTTRAFPQQCLGVADTLLQRFAPAEQAFLAGRGFAAESDHTLRAKLGSMAGNAALAEGRNDAALADFDLAVADAGSAGDAELGGQVQADRSRALVALGKLDEAGAALAIARRDAPQDAETWLLSATLARRQNDLATAQSSIETAVGLDPKNPDIGLEAGVIAALGGRDDAARKSFQSVLDMSPGTPEGDTARSYLTQLGGPGDGAAAATTDSGDKPAGAGR